MVEDRHCTGCRIECEGHIGTVKYFGTVGTTNGQWLGIDWDDSSRGKHNGTYEGIKYYETWHPTSGSFIRPIKANFGISCSEAIKIRYGFVDDELAGIDRNSIASVQKTLKAPFVEMVGFSKVNKKQSQFDQLKIVCLYNECISNAGIPNELATLCPQIEDIDLSHNLISSWKVITEICIQLRALKQLNVSDNNLPAEMNMELYGDAFLNLRQLMLVKMNYNWLAVTKCLMAFPSIQELLVSYNVIETLSDIEDNSNIMKLTELSLEKNLISNWDEILKLGKLPCLRSLNLNSNKIKVIRFPSKEATDKVDLFPSLIQFHISDNCIEDWRSVSELEKLKSLRELKFRKNPLLKGQNMQTGMQLIVARIANLNHLNGTEIIPSDRRGAEYDYLKLFSSGWKSSEKDAKQRHEFIINHPRFPALVEKYGVLDTSELKINKLLSSNVITVKFICPDNPNFKEVDKKLMRNMDVQKLIGIVQRLFRINGKIPLLSFIRPNVSQDEIPLDKPLRELSYYLIEEGDLILVRW
ncbi:PREDICTED: tubulin-specific chaperone E [Ceratosolen solmsi marchali]|uniref:Tubulin-specific chaperone E n=1 Tax=Ceratosolen solmsi marchali TaxID=326594 RepID=A0AAJ6YRT1_9HYME|nr:PREDICTED: tubulin-specific chaperone E [Ceratosolen solmsi marchali]